MTKPHPRIRQRIGVAVAVVLGTTAATTDGRAGAAPVRSPARSAAAMTASSKPCTPGDTAAQQDVSPSVAALGNSERQEIVVYRGVGSAAGCLITARTDGAVTVHRLGIARSSAPVVAEIGGSTIRYQIAFQANTTRLWTTGQLGTRNLHLGMAAATSPSIINSGYGDYDIAIQANTGTIWTTGHLGTRNLHLPIAAGTSPSIASIVGGVRIAYQGRNGHLWLTNLLAPGTPAVGHDLGLGMMAGTSPSLTEEGNDYQIAFQANTGRLWTTGTDGRRNLHYGMAAHTSPAIYRNEIAVQTNQHRVYVVSDTGKRIAVLPGTAVAGSTPSVTVVAVAVPPGAMRSYGRQVAYATTIAHGGRAERTDGVMDRLFRIP